MEPGRERENRIFYHQAVDDRQWWDGGGWSVTEAPWTTLSLNTYYIYELISDGTDWRVVVSDASGATLTTTDAAPWSNVLSNGDPFWFYWGEVYTTHYWAEQRSDWIIMRDYVAPEPSTVLGVEEHTP
jgi:hypothetical protein